jgi:alkyl hydroperoxide reductase subunit F
MLDANLQTQLKAYLEKVTLPFEIVASLDDSAKSQELLELLQSIVGLTDKITLKTDGSDARPAYTVLHQNATFTAKPKSIKWKASPAFAMDFRAGNFGA